LILIKSLKCIAEPSFSGDCFSYTYNPDPEEKQKQEFKLSYFVSYRIFEFVILFSQENVTKTRLEYERCLEQFNLAKAKHEEQKSKGSKRSDEYRDRYIKVI
jgi:hypothetical protein